MSLYLTAPRAGADPETSIAVVLTFLFMHFFIHHYISQRAIRTSLKKRLGNWVPLFLEEGPYQYCLRKHIATCDFPGVVPTQITKKRVNILMLTVFTLNA